MNCHEVHDLMRSYEKKGDGDGICQGEGVNGRSVGDTGRPIMTTDLSLR